MFKLGEKSIKSLYYGSKAIIKAYLGSKCVFSASNPKPYYCEVEYLETTGTQHIDTGLPFHFQEDTITLRAELTELREYQTIYGVNEKFDDTVQFFGVRQLSTQEKWQALNVALSFPAFALNKKFTLQLSRVDTTFFQYDGEAMVTGITNNMKDTTRNAFVFATNNNGSVAFNSVGKIYAFQHKRAGVIVRDLIPVLDWDMTPCMYDKVSGELFYNAGKGSFVTGKITERE